MSQKIFSFGSWSHLNYLNTNSVLSGSEYYGLINVRSKGYLTATAGELDSYYTNGANPSNINCETYYKNGTIWRSSAFWGIFHGTSSLHSAIYNGTTVLGFELHYSSVTDDFVGSDTNALKFTAGGDTYTIDYSPNRYAGFRITKNGVILTFDDGFTNGSTAGLNIRHIKVFKNSSGFINIKVKVVTTSGTYIVGYTGTSKTSTVTSINSFIIDKGYTDYFNNIAIYSLDSTDVTNSESNWTTDDFLGFRREIPAMFDLGSPTIRAWKGSANISSPVTDMTDGNTSTYALNDSDTSYLDIPQALTLGQIASKCYTTITGTPTALSIGQIKGLKQIGYLVTTGSNVNMKYKVTNGANSLEKIILIAASASGVTVMSDYNESEVGVGNLNLITSSTITHNIANA